PLLETIFVTHQPTWDDCQQLLQVLFTTEEWDKIHHEAQKLVMGPNPLRGNTPRIPPYSKFFLPRILKIGTQTLLTTLLGGLRVATRRPTNMSKVTEVVQGTEESPSALEKFMEVYFTFTPIDPEAPENRKALNLAFVSQAAQDIRTKLQKLDG
ncbi:Hypothetical predicted protein, partial [Lynx pardinus]